MKMNVHNMKEARALVIGWNRASECPADVITFFTHETNEYIGQVMWSSLHQNLAWCIA